MDPGVEYLCFRQGWYSTFQTRTSTPITTVVLVALGLIVVLGGIGVAVWYFAVFVPNRRRRLAGDDPSDQRLWSEQKTTAMVDLGQQMVVPQV